MPTGRVEHASKIAPAFSRIRLVISQNLKLSLADIKAMSFADFLFYYRESVKVNKTKNA